MHSVVTIKKFFIIIYIIITFKYLKRIGDFGVSSKIIKTEITLENSKEITTAIVSFYGEDNIYLITNFNEYIFEKVDDTYQTSELDVPNEIEARTCTKKILDKDNNLIILGCFFSQGDNFIIGEIELDSGYGFSINGDNNTIPKVLIQGNQQIGLHILPNKIYLLTYICNDYKNGCFIEYNSELISFNFRKQFSLKDAEKELFPMFTCNYISFYQVIFCLYTIMIKNNEMIFYVFNSSYELVTEKTYSVGASFSAGKIYSTPEEKGVLIFPQEINGVYIIEVTLLSADNNNFEITNYDFLSSYKFSNDLMSFINDDIFVVYGLYKTEFSVLYFYSRKNKKMIYFYKVKMNTNFISVLPLLSDSSELGFINYYKNKVNIYLFNSPKCNDNLLVEVLDEGELDIMTLYQKEQNETENFDLEISFVTLPEKSKLSLLGIPLDLNDYEEVQEFETQPEKNRYTRIKYIPLVNGTFYVDFIIAKGQNDFFSPSSVCRIKFSVKISCYKTCETCNGKGNEINHRCTLCKSEHYMYGSNCYIIPEGYFKEETTGTLEKCYESCSKCTERGNFYKNNCDKCKKFYVWENYYHNYTKYSKNCVKICNPEISFWFYNISVLGHEHFSCTNNSRICPLEYPHLNTSNGECVASSSEDLSLIVESMESNKIVDLLKKNYSNFFNAKKEYKTNDLIFRAKNISDEFEEKYNNMPSLNLSECETSLRRYYSIPTEDNITIIEFYYLNEKTKKEKELKYLIFDSKGNELDPSICKTVGLTVNLSDYNGIATLQKWLLENQIAIFNNNDTFFNNYCLSFQIDGKDTTIFDRRKVFFLSSTLCNSNCSMVKYSKETEELKCLCKYDNNFFYEYEFNIDFSFEPIPATNVKLFNCFNTIISINAGNSVSFLIFLLPLITQFVLDILIISFYFFSNELRTIPKISQTSSVRIFQSVQEKDKINTIKFGKDLRNIKRCSNRKKTTKATHKNLNSMNQVLSLSEINITFNRETFHTEIYQFYFSFSQLFLRKNPIYLTFSSPVKGRGIRCIKISYFVNSIIIRFGINALLYTDHYVSYIFNHNSIDYGSEFIRCFFAIILSGLVDYSFKILLFFIIKPLTFFTQRVKLLKFLIGLYCILVLAIAFVFFYFSCIIYSIYPMSSYNWIYCGIYAIIYWVVIFPTIIAGLLLIGQIMLKKYKIFIIVTINKILYLL